MLTKIKQDNMESPVKKMTNSQKWDAGIGIASGIGAAFGVPPSLISAVGQGVKGVSYDEKNEEGYVDPNAMAATKAAMIKNTAPVGGLDPNQSQSMNLLDEPITKYGKVKSLAAMTGTVSHNMSVAQYKDEKKFSAIAMKLGDLDKDGEMSEYETKRQNAIEKNMNK
tara:strand:- start:42 stop:542 length:501 start_codon:yes stop_codon:yes gene_type:complete